MGRHDHRTDQRLSNWPGDPNFGTGQNQPGGWTYNILPFIEQQAVHDLGIGLAPSAAQKALLGKAAQVTIAAFSCPSRRTAVLYPLATWTCIHPTRGDIAPANASRGPTTRPMPVPIQRPRP